MAKPRNPSKDVNQKFHFQLTGDIDESGIPKTENYETAIKRLRRKYQKPTKRSAKLITTTAIPKENLQPHKNSETEEEKGNQPENQRSKLSHLAENTVLAPYYDAHDLKKAYREHKEEQALLPDSEKLGLIAASRSATSKVVDTRSYELIQKTATYASIFAEPIYQTVCAKLGVVPDQNGLETFRLGLMGIFGGNIALKSFAIGPKYLTKPEFWIDVIAIGFGVFKEYLPDANPRIARLFRSIKGVKSIKMMRGVQEGAKGNKQAREDQSMEQFSEKLTWSAIALFGFIMPFLSNFKEFDFNKIEDTGQYIFGNLAIIGGAKIFTKKDRKILNENYTSKLNEAMETAEQIIEAFPELAGISDYLHKLYEDESGEQSENNPDELLSIINAFLAIIIMTRNAVNPIQEQFHFDENGEIETTEFDGMIVFTDLRGFTPLSKKWGTGIFQLLKYTYFSHLKECVKRYGGMVLNTTGDGLVLCFKDKIDKQRGLIPKEQLAIACTKELNNISTRINSEWRKQGISDQDHLTGFGVSIGEICAGDVLSSPQKDVEATDERVALAAKNLNEELEREVFSKPTGFDLQDYHETVAPNIAALIETIEKGRNEIERIVALCPTINIGARLEAKSKNYPDYFGLMLEEDYKKLPEDLHVQYKLISENETFKGYEDEGEFKMYGIPRPKTA